MIRRLFPSLCILAVLVVLVSVAQQARTTTTVSLPEAATRSFEFTYQVHLPPTENSAGPVRLWIPLPQPDGYQDLGVLHIDSPVAHSEGRDPEYDDTFAMFRPTPQQAAAGFDVTLRFTATSTRSL